MTMVGLRDRMEHLPSGTAGGVALAAVIVLATLGLLVDPVGLRRAWMSALLVLSGPPLGALALLLIGHLAGGAWFPSARAPLAALAWTIPLLAVLALPLIGGHHQLYPDMAAGAAAGAYRAPHWVAGRLVLFVLVWTLLVHLATRGVSRSVVTGAVGLLVLVPTASLAAVDWVVAIAPGWTSTVAGLLFAAAAVLAATAMLPLMSMDIPRPLPVEAVRQQGALLLTALLVVIYLAFVQFLVVWSADLPREASWYLRRMAWPGQGMVIATATLAASFALLLLLRPTVRTRLRALWYPALLALAAFALHRVWEVVPAFARPPAMLWLLIVLAATGALWGLAVVGIARRIERG